MALKERGVNEGAWEGNDRAGAGTNEQVQPMLSKNSLGKYNHFPDKWELI